MNMDAADHDYAHHLNREKKSQHFKYRATYLTNLECQHQPPRTNKERGLEDRGYTVLQ